MAKFEIGDRVRVVSVGEYYKKKGIKVGDTGTILGNNEFPWVRMDKYNENFGDADGLCEYGHGACFYGNKLELIKEEIPATQKVMTPMQELIKDLKELQESLDPYGLHDAIEFAESMLEKEKEVMCEFADDYQRNCFQKSADDYYNETFKTKEK